MEKLNNKIEMNLLIFAPIFAALTTFGAFIRIPFLMIPVTMQTFFVISSGIILGAKGGFLSQIIYILIGLVGLPVFSQGGGLSYVFKPSFGYIIGFPAGAFLTGLIFQRKIADKKNIRFDILFSSLAGLSTIYVFGLIYLSIYLVLISEIPTNIWNVIYTGFIIFIPGMLLKLVLLTYIMPLLLRLINRK